MIAITKRLSFLDFLESRTFTRQSNINVVLAGSVVVLFLGIGIGLYLLSQSIALADKQVRLEEMRLAFEEDMLSMAKKRDVEFYTSLAKTTENQILSRENHIAWRNDFNKHVGKDKGILLSIPKPYGYVVPNKIKSEPLQLNGGVPKKIATSTRPSSLPIFLPIQLFRAQMPDLTKFTESGWVGIVIAAFVLIGTIVGIVFRFLTKQFNNQREIATSLTDIHTIVSETKVIIDERLPRHDRR